MNISPPLVVAEAASHYINLLGPHILAFGVISIILIIILATNWGE